MFSISSKIPDFFSWRHISHKSPIRQEIYTHAKPISPPKQHKICRIKLLPASRRVVAPSYGLGVAGILQFPPFHFASFLVLSYPHIICWRCALIEVLIFYSRLFRPAVITVKSIEILSYQDCTTCEQTNNGSNTDFHEVVTSIKELCCEHWI